MLTHLRRPASENMLLCFAATTGQEERGSYKALINNHVSTWRREKMQLTFKARAGNFQQFSDVVGKSISIEDSRLPNIKRNTTPSTQNTLRAVNKNKLQSCCQDVMTHISRTTTLISSPPRSKRNDCALSYHYESTRIGNIVTIQQIRA